MRLVHLLERTHAQAVQEEAWHSLCRLTAAWVASPRTPRPAGALLGAQLILCGFVETKRWQDFRKPGSQAEKGSFLGFESSLKGVENGYPGGPFDPMGLSK